MSAKARRLNGLKAKRDRIVFPLPTLGSPAIMFAYYAAPCRKALGRMLNHPLGELRRTHQTGVHGDVGEVRSGDGLLVASSRRRKTTEHCDDLDHDNSLSLHWALAIPTLTVAGALSCRSLTGLAGGKTLSYIARASLMRRTRSRSDFEINRKNSSIFCPFISFGKVGCRPVTGAGCWTAAFP